MANININTINYIIEKYKVMTEPDDFKTHLLLLEYVNPSSVWELGAGRGSWCLALHELVDNKDICYNLVEDFSWCQKGYDKLFVNYPWPQNINDLENFIKSTESDINYKIFDGDILDFKESLTNIEMIRIDCDLPNARETIELILNNSNDNLVILIDDIKPNGAFNRLFEMLEFVQKNRLKIILTANETVALAKPSFDPWDFYAFVSPYKPEFRRMGLRNEFFMFDKQAEYVYVW